MEAWFSCILARNSWLDRRSIKLPVQPEREEDMNGPPRLLLWSLLECTSLELFLELFLFIF